MENNTLDIVGFKTDLINLFPESVTQEIIQNIRMILTTVAGSVPLDRKFGIDNGVLDEPNPRAMMKLAIFILESIQEYEPRVNALEIDFVPDINNAGDGRLFPKVKVRILDEYIA